MQTAFQIPRPAFVFGWLGVDPFAAFALSATTGGVLSRGAAISSYGEIILSFMGGGQWGLAMVTTRSDPTVLQARLAISVLPALAAVGLRFLPAIPALLGLAAVFVVLLLTTSRRRVQAQHRGGFRRCVSS